MTSPRSCSVAGYGRLFAQRWFTTTLVLVSLASGPLLPAANLTLSQALLDSVNSEVNFALATIGSGGLAVANTLAPGDTVFIEAHTRKRLVLKNLTQGTVASPITITNTGGQFVIDIAVQTDTDGKGITLAGCQHVVLRGTPSPGNYDYGIKINRTRRITGISSSGVKVTDNSGSGAGLIGSLDVEITNLEIANTGFAGIQAKCEATMPTGYVMDGLHIHHNYIHDTYGEGMYLGWTSSGRHDLANVEVNNNLLVNIGWDGIQVNTCVTNGLVHHNTIIGYGVDSDTAVTEVNNPNYWQNEGINGGRNEIAIYSNWVQATTDLAGTPVFFQVYKDLRIHNNVLIHMGVSGDPAYEPGIYLGTSGSNPVQPGATVKILNNTIITPEGPGLRDSTTAPVYYYNNIVAAPRNGSAYTTGTINFSGTNLHIATVAAAGFVDPANQDYDLLGSSTALDTGTDVSSHGVTTDLDDVARPIGPAYDIGAYEAAPRTIITPTAGQASGSGYCPAGGAFNEQPIWAEATQEPVGVAASPHTGTGTAYANRHWYVDFGADYAKIRLTGMWTRYRPSSPGSYAGFPTLWWDDDKDNVNDGTPATGINFATAQSLPNSGSQLWVRDCDFTGAPVTPAARYLIVSTGPSPSDRPNEFAFVGYILP